VEEDHDVTVIVPPIIYDYGDKNVDNLRCRSRIMWSAQVNKSMIILYLNIENLDPTRNIV